jgi:hypothetical protein
MPRMNRAQPMEAPVSLLPLPRPLMTGEVLDAAFRLFRAGLLRSLPYSGLAVLVLELPTLDSTFLTRTLQAMGANLPFLNPQLLTYFIVFLLLTLLLGLIALRLQAVARGAKPRFRVELRTALRRWPAAMVTTAIALGFPLALFTAGELLNNMLSGEAMLVLAVPILWPTALLVCALPAFWCDGRGPFAALARSVALARRRSWRMVGAVLATVCMVAVFYVLAAIILAMLSQVVGRADLYLISTVRALLTLVAGAFGLPFVLAVLIVAYEDLALRDVERRGVGA